MDTIIKMVKDSQGYYPQEGQGYNSQERQGYNSQEGIILKKD